MGKVERFEDLEIWQLARETCNNVYEFFETTGLGKNYVLHDQMDKCWGSVKVSCGELRSQLYRALDRNHIDEETFDSQFDKVLLESKKISSLMNYLINSKYKGSKYNQL